MRSLLACAALVAGLSVTAAAKPVTFTFPAETTPPPLAGEDAAVVVASCSGCHSLDYIATQPPHKGAQFWRDEVTKMITVYKAPVEPADADAVVEVLARKFG
ncbi:MAG TPA: cytochrome C [Novosphingobium sp.]